MSLRAKLTALAVSVLMIFGVGLAVAQPAQANAVLGVSLYNRGPGGIGIITQRNFPPSGYNEILQAGYRRGGVWGIYVGKAYCTDVYYNGGYRWTGRGGEFGRQHSLPATITDYVEVYSYFCGW